MEHDEAISALEGVSNFKRLTVLKEANKGSVMYRALLVVHVGYTPEQIYDLYLYRCAKETSEDENLELRPTSVSDIVFESIGAFTIGGIVGYGIGTAINALLESFGE